MPLFSTEYTLHIVCCFSLDFILLKGIYRNKTTLRKMALNFSRKLVSAVIHIILHTHFDLLKSKLANIPGELDETTNGYNQWGQEPQQTIAHKGWLLPTILTAKLAFSPIRNWLPCQFFPSFSKKGCPPAYEPLRRHWDKLNCDTVQMGSHSHWQNPIGKLIKISGLDLKNNVEGSGSKAAVSLSGVTSRDSQGEHNYWASNSVFLHFHFSKNLLFHGTIGKEQRKKQCEFSNKSRPGKRHRKFKSVGTDCFVSATKCIQMHVSISSCFLFISSQETPGSKAGEFSIQGGCWLSRQMCRFLTAF